MIWFRKKKKPVPDPEPATVKEAVDQVVNNISEEDRNKIKSTKNDRSYEYHHTVGRYLRNNWSLWEPDTPLKRDAVYTYGIAHADDISGLILSWVWAEIRGVDFDPHQECERFHRHWEAYGTDSLTAGGWPPKN